MPKVQPEQALTDWSGDAVSLIAEMKRRAGVGTDQQLARFLGVAQSTVAHWRNRARVPEAARLKFERILAMGGEPATARAIAARMVVMRLGEYWYQTASAAGATGGRFLFYSTVALTYQTLQDAVYERLIPFERETGKNPLEIAGFLLDDDQFLRGLLEYAKTIQAAPSLAREAMSPPAIKRPPAAM